MTEKKHLQKPKRSEFDQLFGDFSAEWQRHCRNVATLCEVIAVHISGVDPEYAFLYGLVHDIGRSSTIGRKFPRTHATYGYYIMKKMGYPELGMSCLTHSFPDLSDFLAVPGFYNPAWDPECNVDPKDMDFWVDIFLPRKLKDYTPTYYDNIVCLADIMSAGDVTVTVEERLEMVKEKYGRQQNEDRVERAVKKLKQKIEDAMNKKIEDVIKFHK